MSNVYASSHPLVAHKLSRLRDKNTEPKKFRDSYARSPGCWPTKPPWIWQPRRREVVTPLAVTRGVELQQKIGLVPVLRAGLGMVEGIWELMPVAEVWHIGLYRDEHTLARRVLQQTAPRATVSVCLILDPMLATGGSATATADVLKRWGVKKIKFVGLIGAPEGIAAMQKAHPDIDLHLAAVDERLNERAYILPGLGDAGDRQFGTG